MEGKRGQRSSNQKKKNASSSKDEILENQTKQKGGREERDVELNRAEGLMLVDKKIKKAEKKQS